MFSDFVYEKRFDPQDKKILHAFVTNFMIVYDGWMTKLKKTREQMYSKEAILTRLDNMKKYYRTWVDNQTCQNFFIFIVIDQELERDLILELRSAFPYNNVFLIKNGYGLIDPFFLLKSALKMNEEYNDYSALFDYYNCDGLDEYENIHQLSFEHVIVSRIDDDDIIYKGLVQELHDKALTMEKEILVCGYNAGYYLVPDGLHYMNSPNTKGALSIALSVIIKCSKNNIKYFTASFGVHRLIKERLHVIINKNYFVNPVDYKIDYEKYFDIEYNERKIIYNRLVSHSPYSYTNKLIDDKEKGYVLNNFPNVL